MQNRLKTKALSPRQAALKVIKLLRNQGYQALLAGGCVRDMLLNRHPKDYDVATNATPKTVSSIFPRTLTIGAQFGVVVVLIESRQIEVATFRSDLSYTDGRRPDKIVYTDTRSDAERRDFTINGMFYDPIDEKVIDYVGGQNDLKKHLVRAIGDPGARFREDHLRMLRAIRFACRFEFSIENNTWLAIIKHASKIKRVSPERIAVELEHILVDPNRVLGIQLSRQSNLIKQIFPALDPNKIEKGIDVIRQLPQRCSFALALAALLSEFDSKNVAKTCRDLRTSNDLRKKTRWLVESRKILLKSMPLKRGPLKKWLAEPLFETLVQLIRSHLKAQQLPDTPLRQLRRQINELGDEPISPSRLLGGHELIRLGAQPGPTVGQLVEEIYLAQLENHIKTKADAKKWAQEWLKKHQD
ncbi:MAG: CCA tRNA nucleotidyltransferase [Planctomycetes bacterium]|nr:CCA tRNA nucleotidyltransferase [Planctomycetota bacterium]